MKTLFFRIILLANFCATMASAKDGAHNDFSGSDSEIKILTPEEMSWRFHITGEVFILNNDGDKLINIANERRDWQFAGPSDKPLESNWRFQQKGLPVVALKHKWTLAEDGKIHVEIFQYDEIERRSGSEIKLGKVIKTEKITLKNFAPIDWPIAAGAQKLIVRFTPGVWQNEEPMDLTTLPMNVKNLVIYDKTGKLWADQVTAGNASIYFGVTTHEGSILISFSPFKGASLIGEAKGSRIKIKNGKSGIFLQSETAFLPRDVKANVYGILKREIRSASLGSIRTYTSNKAEEFVKAFSTNESR